MLMTKNVNIAVNGIMVNFSINEGNNVVQAYGFLVGGGEAELLALSGRPSEFEGKNINDLFLEALKKERQEWEGWLSDGSSDESSKEWIRKIFRIVDNDGKVDVLHVVQGTDDFDGSYPDLPGYGEDTIFRDEEWLDKAERYLPEEDEEGDLEVRMNLEHNGWPAFIAMETMSHLEMFYDERPSGTSQMTGEEAYEEVVKNAEKYIEDEVLPALEEEDPDDEEEVEQVWLELPDKKGWLIYEHSRGFADLEYRPFEEDKYTRWDELSDDTKRNLATWSQNIVGWEV